MTTPFYPYVKGRQPRSLSYEDVRELRATLDSGGSIAGWENDLIVTVERALRDIEQAWSDGFIEGYVTALDEIR